MKRWQKLRLAQEEAKQCGQCEAPIGPKDDVYMACLRARPGYDYTTWLVPVCKRCSSGDSYERFRSWRCETCGRIIWYPAAYIRRRCYSACSLKCRQAIHAAIAKAKRPDNNKTCAICAKSFLAPRADALTCSSACRQKAYRQRHRLTKGKAAP
jgi:hypothetical protein